MTQIAIRLRNLGRDIDTWTDRTVDPENTDQCVGVLRNWCKTETKKGRRTDPKDYVIRVRKDGRRGWTTHEI